MQRNGNSIIYHQRVHGSIRAIIANQNTLVFLMDTRVVADVPPFIECSPPPA